MPHYCVSMIPDILKILQVCVYFFTFWTQNRTKNEQKVTYKHDLHFFSHVIESDSWARMVHDFIVSVCIPNADCELRASKAQATSVWKLDLGVVCSRVYGVDGKKNIIHKQRNVYCNNRGAGVVQIRVGLISPPSPSAPFCVFLYPLLPLTCSVPRFLPRRNRKRLVLQYCARSPRPRVHISPFQYPCTNYEKTRFWCVHRGVTSPPA